MANDWVSPLNTDGSMPDTTVSKLFVVDSEGAMTLGVEELSSPKSHMLFCKQHSQLVYHNNYIMTKL